MTNAQVKSILSELNAAFPGSYTENNNLILDEVALIVLDSDETLYPERTLNRFYFDTENELLFVYYGRYNSDGEFILNSNPEFVIDFEFIIGFILATDMTQKNQYKIGMR